MKKTLLTLTLAAVATFSANALTIGVDVGTNITNDGLILLPYVPQFGSQSAASGLDWLSDDEPDETFEPGQVAWYNSITTSSLPQPGALVFQDDDGSENGTYQFAVGAYYVVGHWGQANAGFYLTVTDALATYAMASKVHELEGLNLLSTDPLEGFLGHLSTWSPPEYYTNGSKAGQLKKEGKWKHTAGGFSNIRVYEAGTTTVVPDSGTTLALLGASLLALIGLRSRKN